MFISSESMSQWSNGTCREQEKIVFIPEVKSIEEGEDVAMWLVLAGLEVVAEGTKHDCWNMDTRWTYCSWVKPVWETEEIPSLEVVGSITCSELTTFQEATNLLALGYPCFW